MAMRRHTKTTGADQQRSASSPCIVCPGSWLAPWWSGTFVDDDVPGRDRMRSVDAHLCGTPGTFGVAALISRGGTDRRGRRCVNLQAMTVTDLESAEGRQSPWAPLRFPVFRALFIAQLASNIGTL